MATSNKAILRQFMETIWNTGDFARVPDFVADAYTIEEDRGDPWEGQTLDQATFTQRVRYSRDAFPDLRFDIQEMVAEADNVVAKWFMSGTHLGDLPQLPATGRSFKIAGMTIYRINEGKVCGHVQVFDQLAFLGQIGFLVP